MLEPLLKLSALSWNDRRLLYAAVWRVAGVRAALWLLPSPVIVRVVRRIASNAPERHTNGESMTRLIWAVRTVSRHVPHATCLTQAIAAILLLHRHGHAARLCLGVAHSATGGLRAHAWLEASGCIVLGAEGVGRLTPLPAIEVAPWRTYHDPATR